MSEAFDRVLGIDTLPLFPLPLVLLPNEVLPLHIFEPRYRQMLRDVKSARGLFGVSYFEPKGAAGERPEEGTVGCAAAVQNEQLLPDGRSNIIAQGIIRYRLHHYADTETPYLTAQVDFFEDETDATPQLKMIADEVYEIFGRVAKAAFKLSNNRGQIPEIPKADPEKLSFLVTSAFNLDADLKLELLSTTVTAERLERLRTILEKAVDQMEENAEIHVASQTNGHSKKKIDIG